MHGWSRIRETPMKIREIDCPEIKFPLADLLHSSYRSEQPDSDIETSKNAENEVRGGQAMKHLILSFLLFMALCLPVLAGNGQGQTQNGQSTRAAPGPVAGTGLVAAVGCGVYWIVRRRRRHIK
jgi:hypothetical protein